MRIILKNFKKNIKQLTCRHTWERKAAFPVQENGLRYSILRYICPRCGKTVYADSRSDSIAAKLATASRK